MNLVQRFDGEVVALKLNAATLWDAWVGQLSAEACIGCRTYNRGSQGNVNFQFHIDFAQVRLSRATSSTEMRPQTDYRVTSGCG
jgi:hypothetical protein